MKNEILNDSFIYDLLNDVMEKDELKSFYIFIKKNDIDLDLYNNCLLNNKNIDSYISIKIITTFSHIKEDELNKLSTTILSAIRKFILSKYSTYEYDFYLNYLKTKYKNIIEKYIIPNSLNSTQIKILLDTYDSLKFSKLTKEEEIKILDLLSNSKINIANIKVISNMIKDNYYKNLFYTYIIDYGYRNIITDINLYNYKQLLEIYKGMKSEIDWSKYGYYMISENNMKIIRSLLESGVDVNTDDKIIIDIYDNKKKK